MRSSNNSSLAVCHCPLFLAALDFSSNCLILSCGVLRRSLPFTGLDLVSKLSHSTRLVRMSLRAQRSNLTFLSRLTPAKKQSHLAFLSLRASRRRRDNLIAPNACPTRADQTGDGRWLSTACAAQTTVCCTAILPPHLQVRCSGWLRAQPAYFLPHFSQVPSGI